MFRIDNSTASPSLPAPSAAGPNPNSYFTKGDPASATPATIVDDEWLNTVQEELCGAITGSGQTLAKNNRGQLKSSIDYLAQKGQMSYTASTSAANTYTATLTPAPTAYTTGMAVRIKFTNANTGAATLNLNSIGAVAIQREDGSALSAGDIAAGSIVNLTYDGAAFRLDGVKAWQFNASIGTNGYQKFPTGLIMQWGSISIPANSDTKNSGTITFPIAFPTAHLQTILAFENAPNNNYGHMSVRLVSPTTAGCVAAIDTGEIGAGVQYITNAVIVRYFSIGY